MARHGLHKKAPQINPAGNAQFSSFSSSLPSIIIAPSADDGQAASLTFATAASAFTTITTNQEFIVSATGGTGSSTRTDQVTSTITDPSQYAALTASEAQATSPSSRKSSSTASASSTAASSKSSSNMSTLIPAIVVPIVVVLLASFAAFWFCMRRRHRRELKSTGFVMAGKGEKLSSRTNSSRSGDTGTSAVEKSGPMLTVSEFKPPRSFQAQAPKISMEDIGIARPLTPKDGAGHSSPRRPNDRHGRPSNEQQSYQNFSGPRPNTARDRGFSPSQPPQGRNRSNSSPSKRGPPPSAFDRSRGPLPGRPSPEFRGAPSPVPRQGGPSPIPNAGVFPSTRGLPINPRPAPAPPRPMREPSPSMGHASRAAAPPSLSAPPPGAFNGASPISQYSPIIKETSTIGIGAIPGSNGFASNPQTSDSSRVPPPITTRNLASTDTSRSLSPPSPSGNFLTEENMRIARLANSSRLGFFNTSATSPSANNAFDKAVTSTTPKPLAVKATSAPGQSPTTTSNPSPKLPPPATRSQLIPNDSFKDASKSSGHYNYFANPPASFSKGHSPASSFHSTYNSHSNGTSELPRSYAPTTATNPHRPATAGRDADRHLPSQSHRRQHHERQREDDEESNVSDIDAYEDIDAKSDVSSLNEFERFEFESRNGSQRGSGSVRGLGFNSPDRGAYR